MIQKFSKPCCKSFFLTFCAIFACLAMLKMRSPAVMTLQKNIAEKLQSEWDFLDEFRPEKKEENLCVRLLHGGSLLCKKEDLFVRYPNRCPITKSYWQPQGCNLHIYNASEIKVCMNEIPLRRRKKEILMVGDSRVRFLYDTLKFKLQDINLTAYNALEKQCLKKYYEDKHSGMAIQFVWMQTADQDTIRFLMETLGREDPPILLLIGNTLHPIKTTGGTIEGFHSYKKNFTEMVPILQKIAKLTTVIWMIQAPVKHSFEGTNNLMVQLYNNVAEQLLNGTNIHMMHSAHFIGKATTNYYPDNVHLGRSANKMLIEIVLNYLCNKHIIIEEENVCCVK